jgi:uncharacterized membrane protein
MKKFTWFDFAALVIFLLPVVYLLTVYASLPVRVPMHYDINGKVNRYGSKNEFLMVQAIMLFVALMVYMLLRFLSSIDPKKKVKYSQETFQKIALGIVIFISALNIVIIFSTVNQGVRVDKLIFPLIGLLFTFLGNVMNNIKPNYFVGIRTPWTLESEDTWKATHRMAGKVWFAGGILLTILTLVLPSNIATVVFMVGILSIALMPVVYSYIYFKNHPSEQNS